MADKFIGIVRTSAVPHLIELADGRIRTIDDIHETLVRNNDQTGVFLWKGADKSGTIGERNGRKRFEGSQIIDFDEWVREWDRLP